MSAFGAVVLEHFRRPRNRGPLPGASFGHEAVNALCGDRVRVEGRVDGDRVADLRFVGDACAICVAAASLLTERVVGLTLAECRALEADALAALLETPIPPARRRCAALPLEALVSGVRALERAYTTAVLLAAGQGTRFGGAKLLAELDGAPIVRRAAARVLDGGPAELIVVVAEDGADIERALDGLPLRIARVARGMPLSASLRAGVLARSDAARRILVALGDQPRIDPAVVRRVVEAAGGPIVVPVYRGRRGHPVRFDVALVPELEAVEGDRGARDIVLRDPSRVQELAVDVDAPEDVDTSADLARLRAAPTPAA